MLAIVNGRPRVLTLLEVIEHFIEHRREVVRRRIGFDLRKAEARAHIFEGLKIALDHLDAVDHADSRLEDHDRGEAGLVAAVRPVARSRPRPSWTCSFSA